MESNNESTAIVKRAREQLLEFYNGNSWVTDNFMNRLSSIRTDQAMKEVAGHNHSIAQLVSHMSAWRNFVVQKLTGNKEYDIEDNSTDDWPHAGEWNIIFNRFQIRHEELLSAIDNFPAESWRSIVPGRNYTFLYLVCGIIQHDYYHYGQIGALLAAMKK